MFLEDKASTTNLLPSLEMGIKTLKIFKLSEYFPMSSDIYCMFQVNQLIFLLAALFSFFFSS